MTLPIQPSHTRDVEFISTPVDLGSIIDLFMRFRLVYSNNGTANASVATSELPADSQEEDIFTWDYDSLHFDDPRLK